MYTQDNVPGPEVRIRPVVRYLVTTYYHPYSQDTVANGVINVPGSSKVVCECENEREAEDVIRALQKLHDSTSQAAQSEQPTQ